MQAVPGEDNLPADSKQLLQKLRKHAQKYGNASAVVGAGHAEECEREVHQDKEAEREQEIEVQMPNEVARPETTRDWRFVAMPRSLFLVHSISSIMVCA